MKRFRRLQGSFWWIGALAGVVALIIGIEAGMLAFCIACILEVLL